MSMTTAGKLYPWLDEEYGPAPPPWPDWLYYREPSEVQREREEILRAQIEARRY